MSMRTGKQPDPTLTGFSRPLSRLYGVGSGAFTPGMRPKGVPVLLKVVADIIAVRVKTLKDGPLAMPVVDSERQVLD